MNTTEAKLGILNNITSILRSRFDQRFPDIWKLILHKRNSSIILIHSPISWMITGRKAGKQPPVAAIRLWMTKNGIYPTAYTANKSSYDFLSYGSRATSNRKNDLERANNSMAFAIAKNIGKYGIPARNELVDIPDEAIVSWSNQYADGAVEEIVDILDSMKFTELKVIKFYETPFGRSSFVPFTDTKNYSARMSSRYFKNQRKKSQIGNNYNMNHFNNGSISNHTARLLSSFNNGSW